MGLRLTDFGYGSARRRIKEDEKEGHVPQLGGFV